MADQVEVPEGVFSILDTDLYKLSMQCGVLRWFPTTRTFCLSLGSSHSRLSHPVKHQDDEEGGKSESGLD